MERAFKKTSLVPYLESSHGGFYLEIALNGKESRTEQEFPFKLMDFPGPLSRIVRANIKTDQEVIIEPVFLLVQNDDTQPKGDGLTPTGNTAVEALWQQTHTIYSQGEKSDHGFIPFPGRQERIPCFKPLFFCKTKQRFFHPPCPVCGNELTLCRDDKKLTHAALDQFSTSSQRYLACDSCVGADGRTTFYKWSRNSFDRVFVKDRFDLISDFKKLRTQGSATCFFPCTTCPLHSECHILDNKAKERIVFFSFYPFYMLLFRACSLNGVDFLKISAGAPPKKQNSMAQDAPVFFFKGDKRLFLEILFIKLSFLNQVLEILTKRANQAMWSGTGLTAQSLWIEPLEGTTPLPWLWNFKISIIDLLEMQPGQNCTESFSAHTFFNFYSALWFHALAVNKTQNLEKILNEIDKGSELFQSPILSMKQIFWSPEQFHAPEIHGQFWTQALTMGQEMRFFRGESPLVEKIADFSQRIIALQEEIKETLFSTSQISHMEIIEKKAALEPEQTGNIALAQILTSILQRWPTDKMGMDQTEQPLPELLPAEKKNETHTGKDTENYKEVEDDDTLETITLSSSLSQTGHYLKEPAVFPSQGSDEDQNEDMDKTMLLNPGIPGKEPETAGVQSLNMAPSDTPWEDPLEKTMIMIIPGRANSPDSSPVVSPTTPNPPDQGFDTLEETIILTPYKHKPGKKP